MAQPETVDEGLKELDKVIPIGWGLSIFQYPHPNKDDMKWVTKETEKKFGPNPRYHLHAQHAILSTASGVFVRDNDLLSALKRLIEFFSNNSDIDMHERVEL